MGGGVDLGMKRKTHLQTRATQFDGEYDMQGDSNSVLELSEKIVIKAKKMLNPNELPNVEFNYQWTYYTGSSRNDITKEEFLRNGGTFEFIAWSDYAGGNKFEVSGELFNDKGKWVLNGYGIFS